MTTKLDELLASIHPARTLQETARRSDEALNSLGMNRAQITDWEEFRRCVIRCMRHVETHVLRLPHGPPDMGVDFEWGRGCQILLKAYGSNGEKAAFEMARTGNDGGAYAVWKEIVRQVAETYAQNEVSARIGRYWESLPLVDKLAVADEYLAKWGHLLPSELTEGSAARVRANLPKVLEEHVRLIQRLGSVGRSL
jgi:hypothetical protein